MRIRLAFALAAGTSFVGGFCSAVAQTATAPAPQRIETLEIAVPDRPPGAIGIGGETFNYIRAEGGTPGSVVKGAPYTADSVSESVQILADGNRITQSTTSQVARDSEGRTRREQNLNKIGPWASEGAPTKIVFIDDPVAAAHYVVDENAKTVTKMPRLIGTTRITTAEAGNAVGGSIATTTTITSDAPTVLPRVAGTASATAAGGRQVNNVFIRTETGGSPIFIEKMDGSEPKTEDLGERSIEGVMAKGTRTTVSIPAGKIGNDRPIDMVTERWYSPELQTLVMSKHTDPRFGESNFRLTHISRSEPSKMLFEPPADYKAITPASRNVNFVRKSGSAQ